MSHYHRVFRPSTTITPAQEMKGLIDIIIRCPNPTQPNPTHHSQPPTTHHPPTTHPTPLLVFCFSLHQLKPQTLLSPFFLSSASHRVYVKSIFIFAFFSLPPWLASISVKEDFEDTHLPPSLPPSLYLFIFIII